MRQRKIAHFCLISRGGADIWVHRKCAATRKRKLSELYRVTVACTAALKGFKPNLEELNLNEPDEHLPRFLVENDITR